MPINATDLRELDGRIVLVCSHRDHHNPPTGLRGTLHVRENAHGVPAVEVELDFPQMFTTRAHHRTVMLTDSEIAQMLASEHYGAFTVMLGERLDPVAPEGNE